MLIFINYSTKGKPLEIHEENYSINRQKQLQIAGDFAVFKCLFLDFGRI